MCYATILGITFHCISKCKPYFFASLLLLYYWQTIIAVFYLIIKLILCGKRKVALIEMAAACTFSAERYSMMYLVRTGGTISMGVPRLSIKLNFNITLKNI